ncbi:MAG: response regulator [Synergistaceae bacterium]|nr:response regulator [Synergistaceae bacterium]
MRKILVVDGNTANLQQIGTQLAGNYHVSLSRTGERALEICGLMCPDIILINSELPGMDGFETNGAIKGDHNLSKVPVIFLTENYSSATEIRAFESGAVDFIRKPVEKNILWHRIELHLKLHDYQTNLENMVKELEDSIFISFADLVERKNDNTGGHLLRTCKYVEILGRELLKRDLFKEDLTEETLEMMVRAAPFHDIGKIGISDIILLKPGPLTSEEYEQVKKHTLIGAKVMSNIYERTPTQLYLKYAVMMAEGHHEWYDGSGYPHGIKGAEIPLCSRIMAVANVYDACLMKRVYRPAYTPREACDIILEGAGSRFDPVVTSVFAAVHPDLPIMDTRPL